MLKFNPLKIFQKIEELENKVKNLELEVNYLKNKIDPKPCCEGDCYLMPNCPKKGVVF